MLYLLAPGGHQMVGRFVFAEPLLSSSIGVEQMKVSIIRVEDSPSISNPPTIMEVAVAHDDDSLLTSNILALIESEIIKRNRIADNTMRYIPNIYKIEVLNTYTIINSNLVFIAE